MSLSSMYHEVQHRINRLDFSMLWPNFKPYKFALYDQNDCYFNGEYIKKTQAFYANTSISYEGEFIAIWFVNQEEKAYDFDTLTASIVHEMFHAFQQESNETRYPNEMEALFNYDYNLENLTIKLQEAKLLEHALKSQSKTFFDQCLRFRKYRYKNYKDLYEYESKVEQIEGSALYVEIASLKQLDETKAKIKMDNLLYNMNQPKAYLPIRVISYSIGACLLLAIKKYTNLNVWGFMNVPYSIHVLNNIRDENMDIQCNDDVTKAIDHYQNETLEIIENILSKNDLVLEGSYVLKGLNVYNARFKDPYIVTTYFFMYQDQKEDKILDGDYVLELDRNHFIKKAFKG